MTIPPSYLGIGMGGHFEGFRGGKGKSPNPAICSRKPSPSTKQQRFYKIGGDGRDDRKPRAINTQKTTLPRHGETVSLVELSSR